MSEPTKYQTILSDQYKRTVEASDTRSFFTHLFTYLQIIHTNPALLELANRGASSVHAELYPDDATKMPDFRNGNQPSPYLIIKWLKESLTDDMGQVQLFYCWLRLFLFYGLRKYPLSNNHPQANDSQYKVGALVLKNEFTNIFRKNTDKDNHVFKRDQYQLCLEIFHPWFERHIEESGENLRDSDSAISTEPTAEKEQAELIFHGQTTPIVKYKGYEYHFESLDEHYDPWKIISYCWTYELGDEVSLDKLRKEADVTAPGGIKEALRKSPLFMKTKKKKGALTPFLKGLSSKYITVIGHANLTSDELKNIENAAINNPKI